MNYITIKKYYFFIEISHQKNLMAISADILIESNEKRKNVQFLFPIFYWKFAFHHALSQ